MHCRYWTLEPIEAAGKYVLAKPEADEESPEGYDIGFYLGKSGTIAAGKAYLDLGGASTVKGFTFVFADTEDGIESIQNSKFKIQNEGVVYNIAGQCLSKAQKGINIINGKKILK